MTDGLNPDVMDRINQALFQGQLIEALKIYRQTTHEGLKEAKDFVEALETRLRSEVPEKFTAPPRKPMELHAGGCLLSLALIAAVAGALAWLLT